MLRSEAMAVAEQLQPEGFKFNSLDLHSDAEGVGIWIATFLNVETDPPEVVIERWHDVYTDADPAPEGEGDEDSKGDSSPDDTPEAAAAGNGSGVDHSPSDGE